MKIPVKIKNSAIYNVVKRELFRFANSRVLPFFTIVAPVIAFLLIMWIFSAGVIRDLPVAVVDNDNTSLSRQATRAIDASSVANIIRISSIEEAHELMNRGKVDAIVLIPADFEKHIFKNQSSETMVFINNTNVVTGGVLKSGIYKSLGTLSAQIKIAAMMKKGIPQYQAIEKVQPVKLNTHILFNPFGNYSYFLTLALLPLMVNVFTFLGTTYAIGIELKEGTAGEWIKTANNNIAFALIGKLLPYTILFFASVLLMNFVLFNVLGTPIKGSLSVILLSEIFLVITYQFLAILVLAATYNLRFSLSVGSAYTMMALTFSGLTFPSIAMPFVAKVFACLFPYTFWIRIFISQTVRNEPSGDIAIYFLILLLFIIGAILSFPLMKKRLNDSRYWGRV